MDTNMVKAACATHIGKRLNHEDNYYLCGKSLSEIEQEKLKKTQFFCDTLDITSSPVGIYAISDGIGGHRAGELASRICIDTLIANVESISQSRSIQNLCDGLQKVIADSNTTVCEISRKNKHYKGLGATLVIFASLGNQYVVLNIGDSRAYYIGKSSIIQLTKDNTEGQRLLDLGILSQREMAAFPARKSLSRYIGYEHDGLILRADEYRVELGDGFVLLCSDGITDSLSDKQILDIVCSSNNIESAVHKLIMDAVEKPNSDNSTAMLISLPR